MRHTSTFCYALGGGLGHLTRVRAALTTLGIDESTAVICSPMESVKDPRVIGRARGIMPPKVLERDREGLREWVVEAIRESCAEQVVLDAFPAGILGELSQASIASGIPVIHLARRLRWSVYSPVIGGSRVHLDRVFRLEELEPEHEAFLVHHSSGIEGLQLRDPLCELTSREKELIADIRDDARPLWLIVHSGVEREVAQLRDLATSMATRKSHERTETSDVTIPRVVDISALSNGSPPVNIYPATVLFPLADRIFTGCGFNSIRQTASFRDRHVCIPFARRFDDQEWRWQQVYATDKRSQFSNVK